MLIYHHNLKIIYKKHKFFIYLFGKIFFVQKTFEVNTIKSARNLKFFWLSYILKVLFHFGLVDLRKKKNFKIIIKNLKD